MSLSTEKKLRPQIAQLACNLLAQLISFGLVYPEEYANEEAYQQLNSVMAIGSGQLDGKGYKNNEITSVKNGNFISEAQTDFIFAIICEELGFVGAMLVILLFAVLIWKGITISRKAPDTFSSLTAAGITALIAIQVLLNIAVVTSTMPVTGVPLPFFSYGGTSLMILLTEVGVLLNISRYISK